MSYEISWHSKAAKYVESLPKHLSRRILDKLEEVAKDPFRYVDHFEGAYYKLRIGEYRALLEIDFTRRVLWVMVFDKRERVYER